MHARRCVRWLLSACILGMLLWPRCAGGSGSSGFDLAESTAITRALTEQICVEHRGLMICPADTAAAGPERIDIGLDTATPLTCFQQIPTGPCGFTVPFAPLGFPSATDIPPRRARRATARPLADRHRPAARQRRRSDGARARRAGGHSTCRVRARASRCRSPSSCSWNRARPDRARSKSSPTAAPTLPSSPSRSPRNRCRAARRRGGARRSRRGGAADGAQLAAGEDRVQRGDAPGRVDLTAHDAARRKARPVRAEVHDEGRQRVDHAYLDPGPSRRRARSAAGRGGRRAPGRSPGLRAAWNSPPPSLSARDVVGEQRLDRRARRCVRGRRGSARAPRACAPGARASATQRLRS